MSKRKKHLTNGIIRDARDKYRSLHPEKEPDRLYIRYGREEGWSCEFADFKDGNQDYSAFLHGDSAAKVYRTCERKDIIYWKPEKYLTRKCLLEEKKRFIEVNGDDVIPRQFCLAYNVKYGWRCEFHDQPGEWCDALLWGDEEKAEELFETCEPLRVFMCRHDDGELSPLEWWDELTEKEDKSDEDED